MALNVMFHDSYKSDTCRDLIDIWRVLRHLQYNISDSIDKSLYDVRASKPYHGGTAYAGSYFGNVGGSRRGETWRKK